MGRIESRKAQAAVEYMLVVAISFIIVTSIGYYFLIQQNSSNDEIIRARSDQIGRDIIKNVEEVYFSAGAKKNTFQDYTFPQEVDKILVENNTLLRIRLVDGYETTIQSSVPFYIFYKGQENFSNTMCIQKITYKGNEYVVVCAVEDCNCEISQTETDCSNGQDDDIDGTIDMLDSDCCDPLIGDIDNDGYMSEALCAAATADGVSGDDCDDTSASVYPGAPELCDEIDQDCDGLTNDVYGCRGYGMDDSTGGISFYFEERAGDSGIGECRPGYGAILSLSEPTNAHVQDLNGVNSFEYELCYMKNPNNVCPTECLTRAGSVCAAGYFKVLSIQDLNLDGGSHVDGPISAIFTDSSVCCTAGCSTAAGGINCRATLTGDPCLSDESCIISLDTLNPLSTGHISNCDDIYFNNKICCKIY